MSHRGGDSYYWSNIMKVCYLNGQDEFCFDFPIGGLPSDYENISRASLPNWQQIINSGSSASNPYSRTANRFIPGPATKLVRFDRNNGVRYDWADAPYLPHGRFTSKIIPADYGGYLSEMKASSILGLYDNIGERFQAVSSSTLLGELAETIRMVKSPLKSMRQHLSKGLKDSKSLKGSSKSAAAFWLEWNFGWLPLALTVNDILEFRQSTGASSRFQNTLTRRVNESSRDTNGVYSFQYDETTYDQIDISVRTVANVSLASRAPDLLALQYGLHLGDLVPTAWELLPWSFAIDYFYNIGSYLNAQKWASLTSTRYAFHNVKIKVKRRCFAVPSPNAYYLISISQPYAGIQEFDYFSREPIILKPPSVTSLFSPETSVKQQVNLAALGLLRLIK